MLLDWSQVLLVGGILRGRQERGSGRGRAGQRGGARAVPEPNGPRSSSPRVPHPPNLSSVGAPGSQVRRP